jgi:hypothetical protein
VILTKLELDTFGWLVQRRQEIKTQLELGE